MSLFFFDNEEEEFNISLDQKFTNVPYFLITAKNKYKAGSGNKLWLLLGVVLTLYFFFIVYKKFIKIDRE